MSQRANDYYAKLETGIDAAALKEWEGKILHAEETRMLDRTAMDIVGAELSEHRDVQETSSYIPRGQAEQWIQLALDVEEQA
jgi:hypothetical protein